MIAFGNRLPNLHAPSTPRRVGLLGAGYIAQWHAAALNHQPGVELVAVADVSLARAKQAAAEFGGLTAYASLRSMIAEAGLDAVHVLTPPDHHATAALECVDAGLAVFLEKPMAASACECDRLLEAEKRSGARLAVNHNFLFSRVYEQLRNAFEAGELGRLDAIDIAWNKPLPQLSHGPFSIWMLAQPHHLMLELGPHVVTPILDLAGEPDTIVALATHPIPLPGHRSAMRNWACSLTAGRVAVQLRLTLGLGLPEFKIHVRGTHGSAVADLEDHTFTLQRATKYSVDFDRYHRLRGSASALRGQAMSGLGRYIGSKFGLAQHGNAYGESIARSIAAFYANWDEPLDRRLTAATGRQTIHLCERIAAAAGVFPSHGEPATTAASRTEVKATPAPSSVGTTEPKPVLVLGGSGFIGRVLVRQLVQRGRRVRLLVRRPDDLPDDMRRELIGVFGGDFTNEVDLRGALDGVEGVYHLARGAGKTWDDYLRSDVEPTVRLAELCHETESGRLLYTSSIDSYFAGRRGGVIVEQTGLDPRITRRNLYAQSKAAIESELMRLHHESGLNVVIARPGIVLGAGGSPFHWGVGMWNGESVCQIWGDGTHPLPLVLVDDVADGLIRAMEQPGVSGESFNLIGENGLSAREYIQELCRASGAAIEALPTPIWQFYAEDLVKWTIKVAVRHPSRRLPSYRDWLSRTQRASFDCSHAKQMLGWNPVADRQRLIRDGIEAAVQTVLN